VWLRRLKCSSLGSSPFSFYLPQPQNPDCSNKSRLKELKATPDTRGNTSRCKNWQSCTKKYKHPKKNNYILCKNCQFAKQYTVLGAIGLSTLESWTAMTFLECPFFLSSTFSFAAQPPPHFIGYRLEI